MHGSRGSHRHRTTALLLVTATGLIDASTIARCVGVPTDGDMLRLLDPLEADATIVSRFVGQTRLYTLASEPWLQPLVALADAFGQAVPRFEGLVLAALILRTSGQHSSRKHLRKLV